MLPSPNRSVQTDLTLDEHCELFEELHALKVSNATMSRAFKRLERPLNKKVAKRTREALVEAIGAALTSVTAQEGRGWFTHCEYRIGDQLS
jgi:hypothetical protein